MRKNTVLMSVACIAGALSVCTPAAAPQWKIYEEEHVSLDYRNAADTESVFSVGCGPRQSEIVIPLAPGIKPPAQAPELRVKEQAGIYPMKLTWDVCGGEMTCTDRPSGDLSTYFVKGKNKQIALRFADRALAFEVDAPGAKLSVSGDKALFARFAALCRKQ